MRHAMQRSLILQGLCKGYELSGNRTVHALVCYLIGIAWSQ